MIDGPRREHSRKPDEIYRRIEALVSGPYLEMFSRQSWPNWDASGDQCGFFDDQNKVVRESRNGAYWDLKNEVDKARANG